MTGTKTENENLAGDKPEEKEESWADFFKFLLKVVLIIVIFRSFIFSPFNIPSESMQPRLLIGDYLFVSKWSYGYSKHSLPFSAPLIPGRFFASEPERGDVVVFKAPPTEQDDYIKRVIGLPGDTVQIVDGEVVLNGTKVPREKIADFVIPVTENMLAVNAERPCYNENFEEAAPDGTRQCRYPRYKETLPNGRSYEVLDLHNIGFPDNSEVYTVPEGHMFLMGDNRDRSQDSRFPQREGQGIGFVPQENLVGKASFTVFSTDGSAEWMLPWTWFSAARWDRIGDGF